MTKRLLASLALIAALAACTPGASPSVSTVAPATNQPSMMSPSDMSSDDLDSPEASDMEETSASPS